MRSSALLPLLALTLSPLASACFQSYYGHSCNGSIYGTANNQSTADISQLICCQDSQSCTILVDGSITSCGSGTALTLSNLTAIPTTISSASPSATAGSGSTGSASASASAKPNAAVRMGEFKSAAWIASAVGLGVGFAAMI